jgi:hypothetical protein
MAISKKKRLQLLKDVSAAYLQLRKTISSLSDAELMKPDTAGKWSGKDVIAHIADWEGVYMGILRDRDAGRPENWPTEDDTEEALDTWNEAQVIAKADWSLDKVREYLEQTHADLMELLERARDIDPDEAIEYTKYHYSMHYDDLMACRAKPAQ